MIELFLDCVLLPLVHWAAISLAIVGLGKLAEAWKEQARAKEWAMRLPLNAEMAEMSFRVTRADGSVEPPRVQRTYRNPLKRWAWAIKQAFKQ
jgi:hypothetical protein